MNNQIKATYTQDVGLALRTWFGYNSATPNAWNTGKPFMLDVSVYQGIINPAPMQVAGVVAVGVRASVGLHPDRNFHYNWGVLKDAGMMRFAYHAVRPDMPRVTQQDLFFQMLGDDQGELPPVLDVERRDGMTNRHISDLVKQMWESFSNWYGDPATIYSSAYMVDTLMDPASWYQGAWWWLAHYLYANPYTGYAEEHPGPPRRPVGVPQERVLIHQTAGKGRGGEDMGVESKNLDLNRYQFDLAHLYALARKPTPPAGLTLSQAVNWLGKQHGQNWNFQS